MTRKAFRKVKFVPAMLALAAGSFLAAMSRAESRIPWERENRPEESARQSTMDQQAGNPVDVEIHIMPVQGNVYMLVGAGANIAVQADADGVLIVDAGLPQMSDKVIAAIRKISDKPIRYIIDTSADRDAVGGNEAIVQAGSMMGPRVGAGDDLNFGDTETKGAMIVAFQSVLDRMSDPKSKDHAPEGAWPMDTYTISRKSLFFNNDRIQIYHQPAAHTDGDSMVLFHHADVISTGAIFTTTGYPVIDLARGGSIQGIIEGLNRLIYDLTAAGDKEEGGTLVIPSYGRLCDQSDVVYFQEMVTIIRDRIQFMIDKGMTLEQVKESKPTRDYDPRYGSTTGPWTTDMFVEAVYKSLAAGKTKPRPH